MEDVMSKDKKVIVMLVGEKSVLCGWWEGVQHVDDYDTGAVEASNV